MRETGLSEHDQRLRSRDPAAWEELYEAMYPAMVSYARRRLPAEEARDAVSEAMARALARPDRMPAPPTSPEAWIFGILRHVVLDVQRRSFRALRALRRTPLPVSDTADPGQGLVSAEEHAEIRTVFAGLSRRDQEVLELRVVAGLSAEDAGRILGLREGAVRNAQHRALRRMRSELEALVPEDQSP